MEPTRSQPRFVRQVVPARVRTTTKVFVAAALLAGVGAGAMASLLQPPPTADRVQVALPAPVHHWRQGTCTRAIRIPEVFTLHTRVQWDGRPGYRVIVDDNHIELATRGSTVEVSIWRSFGQTLHLASSVRLRKGESTRIAVTRSQDRLSLWVNGNETRMRTSAGYGAPAHRIRIDAPEVIIWDQPLTAAQLAALE